MDSKDLRGLMEAYAEVYAPIDELYKGKHGQSEKEYMAGRSDAGKRISGDEKEGPASYASRWHKGSEPTKPGQKPKNVQKLSKSEKEEIAYRKANLKKEETELDEALTGERYKKVMKNPGGTAYSRKVSADPDKRATRGGKGGESDFGAGDRGSGNKARRRAGTYQEYDVNEATYSAKAARAGKDIGKPGKAFAKIAKEAGKRYGSKERGEKVAGAVLAKLRREESGIDEAVKGADTEMRKAASVERRRGDKRLSPSAGKANADKMERDIKFYDKVTKKTKPSVVGMTHEEVDVFDSILEYLVSEGYADNNQEALKIMANLSEEEILEYRKLAAGLVGGMMALNMMKPGIPSPDAKKPVQEPDQMELVKQRDAATEKKDKEERERMTREYQRIGGDAKAKKYGINSDNAEYMSQYHRGRR